MWGMEEISFYQGALAKNIFLGDAFKLEKDSPIFPVFSPCPSWPSVATERDSEEAERGGGRISEKREKVEMITLILSLLTLFLICETWQFHQNITLKNY